MEKQKQDIYQIVTDKVVGFLEDDIIPWRKPWYGKGVPTNLISKRPYRGINVMLLGMLDYEHNYFLSFNQVKAVGGSIRKGEKAQLVVFWKATKRTEEEAEEVKPVKRLLRYYYVFNVAQCTGIPEHLIPALPVRANDTIEACETVIAEMPNRPEIRFKENEAYYHPKRDYVNMPEREYFLESEAYYATFFHELIHSTGHAKRLSREGITEPTNFGSYLYSNEELIAEIGACYLQSFTGSVYEDFVNSKAYIQGWIAKLKGDKRCIIFASSAAQKACDYILNIQYDPPKEESVAHSETSAV